MTTMQWSRPMDTCPWSPTAGPSCAKSPGACAGITATKGRLALLGAPGTSTANTNASAKASATGGVELCLLINMASSDECGLLLFITKCLTIRIASTLDSNDIVFLD